MTTPQGRVEIQLSFKLYAQLLLLLLTATSQFAQRERQPISLSLNCSNFVISVQELLLLVKKVFFSQGASSHLHVSLLFFKSLSHPIRSPCRMRVSQMFYMQESWIIFFLSLSRFWCLTKQSTALRALLGACFPFFKKATITTPRNGMCVEENRTFFVLLSVVSSICECECRMWKHRRIKRERELRSGVGKGAAALESDDGTRRLFLCLVSFYYARNFSTSFPY